MIIIIKNSDFYSTSPLNILPNFFFLDIYVQ